MASPFDIPADLDTPVSAFLKLTPLNPRFLLESVVNGERVGRYSIVGFGDCDRVRLERRGLFINGDFVRATPDASAVTNALRFALDRAPRLEPILPNIPFVGGLVGYASFELAHRFEGFDIGSDGERQVLANYVATRSLLVFDHTTLRVALLHAGSDRERSALRREVLSLLHGPTPRNNKTTTVAPPSPSMQRNEFIQAVEKAKELICAGDVYQLVLSICFSGQCDLAPIQVYRALRHLNPSPYMYFLDLDDLTLVGSSPEALVKLDGRDASLSPIAGTRPRGSNADEDDSLESELRADPKEAAEHVMLVDLARNDVGKVAVPGTVIVNPYRTVEKYSHVMHLVSGVQATLAPPYDALDMFAAAFPAGTVVGAPKIRAMQRIGQMEPTLRGPYAGTVGYFGHGGSMDQAITIRTLVFKDNRYAYQAGAGIVADSIPANEYDEVLAKSAIMQAALDLAGDVE
jgi:anthranilate synthase component I